MRRFLLLVVLLGVIPGVQAYESQFTVGMGAANRYDVVRYNVEAEYYTESLMMGSLMGIWPRLEYETDGDAHSLYANMFTFAGVINFEYAYSSGYADGPHSYGIELNSRFLPAVLIPQLSMRADRLVRNLEVFYRMHRFLGSERGFKQIGLRLTFHFPGFKISDMQ